MYIGPVRTVGGEEEMGANCCLSLAPISLSPRTPYHCAEVLIRRLTTLAIEPRPDRLPLLPVRPCEVLRQLQHAHAAPIGPHVILRLAQAAEVGHFELGQILVQF